MTVQKIFYEYLLLASDDTIEKRERTAKKCVELTEDYHKESSKELVEACKISLHLCDMLRMPTQTDLESLAVDLRKALENHLQCL